jgi:RNA polymerase sigma-70 factor (ECF subfamily)
VIENTIPMTARLAAETEARATFSDVLREQQGMVFSIALHFLRDRSAAEEVAQDVFLQLHRNFDELEMGARMVFWLRKVTANRAIDYIRKRKLRGTVALEDAPEPRSPAAQPDFLLSRRLRTLIATLPDQPRMVMVMRFQEELMPTEIAEILGMPVRTVKSHLQRSLAMLREKIERSMGDVH